MINLVLTRECAKRCSFCFTGNYSKDTEVSLDFIDKLFSHFKQTMGGVNILGGEPTQHSKFTEIIDKISLQYNLRYLLISNLLFPNRILEWLVDNYHNRHGILANGMEMFAADSRFRLFAKNWNKLFLEHSNIYEIIIALTIAKNHTPEYFSNYMKALKNELADIPYIRIGIDLSNMEIINNTMYGDCIRAIQEEYPKSSIMFDCQIPPCIFNYDPNKVLYSFSNMSALCDKPPVDVFADGSAIYGFCVQHIEVDDVFAYDTMYDLNREFRTQYKEKEREQLKEIPNVCKTCDYYLENTCNSLCLGCSSGKQGAERATLPPLPSRPI